MHLQIETITLQDGSKMDVIRDIEKVRKLLHVSDQLAVSVRANHFFKCRLDKCDTCEALDEWDKL